MSAGRTIDELRIADDPHSWRAAGFEVDGEDCVVGSVRLALVGRGSRRGIVSWSVRGPGVGELDGLDTSVSERPAATGARHPNGVIAVDHVVVLTPDLDRTAAALRADGFDQRRLREGPAPGGSTRQAFFRMGEVILEVVQAPESTKVRPIPTVRRASGGSPSWSTTSRPRPPRWVTCSGSRATRCSPAGASPRCGARPAWARRWHSCRPDPVRRRLYPCAHALGSPHCSSCWRSCLRRPPSPPITSCR